LGSTCMLAMCRKLRWAALEQGACMDGRARLTVCCWHVVLSIDSCDIISYSCPILMSFSCCMLAISNQHDEKDILCSSLRPLSFSWCYETSMNSSILFLLSSVFSNSRKRIENSSMFRTEHHEELAGLSKGQRTGNHADCCSSIHPCTAKQLNM